MASTAICMCGCERERERRGLLKNLDYRNKELIQNAIGVIWLNTFLFCFLRASPIFGTITSVGKLKKNQILIYPPYTQTNCAFNQHGSVLALMWFKCGYQALMTKMCNREDILQFNNKLNHLKWHQCTKTHNIPHWECYNLYFIFGHIRLHTCCSALSVIGPTSNILMGLYFYF